MAIWQYTYIMSHHIGLKGQSWKKVMESFHVGSSSFIQKLKAFNISNARQLVLVYCSHMKSLGNFKNKYKTKKEKVRNQTTYITKFSKKEREGDRQRRRRRRSRRRRSSCFTTPPLLHRRLLPFLLLLWFLSLQMWLFMFWLGIHLPAETAGFRQYSRYN